MGLLDLMKEGEFFTNTDRSLSDYVQENAEKVLEMNLRQLAQAAFVSPAAVTRFCKRLGHDNYSQFKVQLSKELTQAWQEMHQVDMNLPFTEKSTTKDIIQTMSALAISNIISIRDQLDPAKILQIGKILSQKKHIDIYGQGLSLDASREFAEKMAHIGYFVTPLTSNITQSHRAAFSGQDQAAIVISYSGMRDSLIQNTKRLKENGTSVVVITGNPQSPLLRYSTISLVCQSKEHLAMIDKIDSFGMLYMFHLIFDCIFASVFKVNYELNRQRIQKTSAGQYPQ